MTRSNYSRRPIPPITLSSLNQELRNPNPTRRRHQRHPLPILRPHLDIFFIRLNKPRWPDQDIIKSTLFNHLCRGIVVIILVAHVGLAHEQPQDATHIIP